MNWPKSLWQCLSGDNGVEYTKTNYRHQWKFEKLVSSVIMDPDSEVLIMIDYESFDTCNLRKKHFYPVQSLTNSVSQRQTSNMCTSSHLTKPAKGTESWVEIVGLVFWVHARIKWLLRLFISAPPRRGWVNFWALWTIPCDPVTTHSPNLTTSAFHSLFFCMEPCSRIHLCCWLAWLR